jgi:hypothetical protein|eukprot:COSAG01_NODE_3674_length_5805_cov_6.114030_4_plen_77_part_00
MDSAHARKLELYSSSVDECNASDCMLEITSMTVVRACTGWKMQRRLVNGQLPSTNECSFLHRRSTLLVSSPELNIT